MDWFDIAWEVFPFLFVSGICVWLYVVIEKQVSSYRRNKRLVRGKNAEDGARKLLESKGYKIHDYQPSLGYMFTSEGEKLKVNITPDFLVKKKGVEYVVEVKTGEVAANPNYAATRRQMLEYNLASEKPLLFVNMETQTINEIRFPFTATKNGINWWKYLSLLMLSVVVVAILAMAVGALLKLL